VSLVQDQDRRAFGESDDLRLLVKALRPLPRNSTDSPTRSRSTASATVDLIMSEETRGVFKTRSRIVQAIGNSWRQGLPRSRDNR